MDFEIKNKYENNTIDTDEVLGTDIKINPDFYIHTGILKAQNALTKENIQEGFIQYKILIEHIEMLCIAANMINEEEYNTEIQDFKKTDEYLENKDSIAKMVKLSTKKLGLLMKNVFSNKVATDPLKA